MKGTFLVCVVLPSLSICTMAATTRYVVPPGGSGAPGSGYTSWGTAATNIQDAVAATTAGDMILVSNGTYYLTKQITVTNFTIRSYNNGAVDRNSTVINGNYPTVTNRCLILDHANAVVEGFTITNGYLTGANYGGGVYLNHGTLRNCQVTGNTITNNVDGLGGAGVYAINADSLISNCAIIANSAKQRQQGGGVYLGAFAQLWNSRVMYNRGGSTGSSGAGGGGVRTDTGAVLCNCIVASNTSTYMGGGVCLIGNGATMRNCLVKGNVSSYSTDNGGVVAYADVGTTRAENCTIVNNAVKVPYRGGNPGLMAVFVNVVHDSAVVFGYSVSNAVFMNCCFTATNMFVNSSANIATDNPGFANAAAGNYRLTGFSPCINTGMTQDWMTGAADLDGNLRIVETNVDMGAYEYPSYTASGILIAWLRQFGLATDGSADYSNGDPDAMNNIQEYLAGTDPTNAQSYLGVTAISNVSPLQGQGFVVQWASVEGKNYRLDRSTNLLEALPFGFSVHSNIPATPPFNTETDTNTAGNGPRFYRIGVQ